VKSIAAYRTRAGTWNGGAARPRPRWPKASRPLPCGAPGQARRPDRLQRFLIWCGRRTCGLPVQFPRRLPATAIVDLETLQPRCHLTPLFPPDRPHRRPGHCWPAQLPLTTREARLSSPQVFPNVLCRFPGLADPQPRAPGGGRLLAEGARASPPLRQVSCTHPTRFGLPELVLPRRRRAVPPRACPLSLRELDPPARGKSSGIHRDDRAEGKTRGARVYRLA